MPVRNTTVVIPGKATIEGLDIASAHALQAQLEADGSLDEPPGLLVNVPGLGIGELVTVTDEDQAEWREYVRKCAACLEPVGQERIAFARYYPDGPQPQYPDPRGRYEDYPIHERCARACKGLCGCDGSLACDCMCHERFPAPVTRP